MASKPMLKPAGGRHLEEAARMFDALSDVARLRTLMRLADGDLSVSEIATVEDEKITTVSARLQVLHAARLIDRRREGKSVIYRIADDHVLTLVRNAVAHAAEKH